MCDLGEDILDTLEREFKEEVTNSKKHSKETPEERKKREKTQTKADEEKIFKIENAVHDLFKNGYEVFLLTKD
jgi:hypothetical protein